LPIKVVIKNRAGGPNGTRKEEKRERKINNESGHGAGGTLSAILVLVGSSSFSCSPSLLSAGAFTAEQEICIHNYNPQSC
jgi:hypothetical protein